MVSTICRSFSVIVAGMCIFSGISPRAHSAGSLSDLDIEFSELKVSIEGLLDENRQLREALVLNAKAHSDVRQNLADASNEAAVFKRQAKQMRLRIDALGIEAVGGDRAKLEQRLLVSMGELRASNEQKDKCSAALVKLAEAVSLYFRSMMVNPRARTVLDGELRKANQALGVQQKDLQEKASPLTLITGGVVVSVKNDLELIVIDTGERDGVKIGMPFQIIRDEKLIGRIRVVDVREKISGAIVQNLNADKKRIKIGDQVKADVHQ
jgi:hypothetical protein